LAIILFCIVLFAIFLICYLHSSHIESQNVASNYSKQPVQRSRSYPSTTIRNSQYNYSTQSDDNNNNGSTRNSTNRGRVGIYMDAQVSPETVSSSPGISTVCQTEYVGEKYENKLKDYRVGGSSSGSPVSIRHSYEKASNNNVALADSAVVAMGNRQSILKVTNVPPTIEEG